MRQRSIPLRFQDPRGFGCYTAYRRVDVLRIVAVARALSPEPRVIDVGCGNGDLLERVREYIPGAIGVDIDERFAVKPYIRCADINDVEERFDLAILSLEKPRKGEPCVNFLVEDVDEAYKTLRQRVRPSSRTLAISPGAGVSPSSQTPMET
ncbi:hypothetical protein DRO56_02800 [Candidatus Bathyarchaeota archaeon]|nr:MAG: hypothetical protein DRO56_02800 [Candidatus Bathyarchaeota archaeon]